MKKIEVQDNEQDTVSNDVQSESIDDVVREPGANDDSRHEEAASLGDRVTSAPTPEEGSDGTGQADEISVLKDRLLRQAAEFQNYRRRVEQERQSDVKFGQSLVIQQLLDVYDDLRRSIEAAEEAAQGEHVDAEAAFGSLIGGVELVFKKFSNELQRFGVEPIEAVGTEFNEQEHEAMMQQPAPEGTAPGIVLAEIQKGFRMGGRVLRHSKVVVSG